MIHPISTGKLCRTCNEVRPFTDFHRDKSSKDGHQHKCKYCYRAYVALNKEATAATKRRSYDIHRDKELLRAKELYLLNKDKIEANRRLWRKRKFAEDPLFKFKGALRHCIKESFKRAIDGKVVKTSKSLDILGCDMEFFIKYMEVQFKDGMSWDNYGTFWHIDHIIPINVATILEHVIMLNHFSNLQPLRADLNLKKASKSNIYNLPTYDTSYSKLRCA